jgi:hypothetical protein
MSADDGGERALARCQNTPPVHVDAAIVDYLDGQIVRKSCVVLTSDIAFDEIVAITKFDKV